MSQLLSATEYRLLVEHSPVMIWRAGLDAKCDYFNDTWLAFTGRTMEQECGDGWAEGVHEEDLDRCVAHYLDHFHRRAPFEMEYRLRRHDGVYRWIFDRGVPYTNDKGEFAGFIGSCVDVDDRRRAQAAEQKQNRVQLAMAHQFGQWVLSIVSHDIRNPLATIDVSARVLAAKAGSEQPALKSIADRIIRSVGRISHLVGDLLDLSREQHGSGIPIVLASADMRAICADVVDEIAAASSRRIEFDCSGETSGTWDANRIAQAVSNLLGNAVQHSPEETPIRVTLGTGDGQVRIAVHNAGAIPEDKLGRLFQPFSTRVDGKSGHQGLGLGLFIARAIAHAHQGDIEVDSAPERGTTFRLSLPRHARVAGEASDTVAA